MKAQLAHRIFQAKASAPTHTAFILHGIWGSGRNWASMARRLPRVYPRWRFVTVDLPGHGDSRVEAGPWTIAQCAQALERLAESYPPNAVIGHSFGGKVALAFGALAQAPLGSIWVLDSPLGTGETATGNPIVAKVLQAVSSLRLPVLDRGAVEAHFMAAGLENRIARWMTTNLRREADGLYWRFQPTVVEALLHDYMAIDGWKMLDDVRGRSVVHMGLAGRSTWWRSSAEERVLSFPDVRVHHFPDAGHWIHVDDPEGLISVLGGLDA